MKSRLELYSELMPLIRERDMAAIKKMIIGRYGIDKVSSLSVAQLEDLLQWLEKEKK